MKALSLYYIICICLFCQALDAQIRTECSPLPNQTLGEVQESQGIQKREFTLRNTGDYSWQILRGYTSCGCTKVNLQQGQVVRPGGSTQVQVSFDPAGKSGPFRETITIQLTDGEEQSNQILTLTGEVRRSTESLKRQFPIGQGNIRVNTAKLDFGEVNRSTITERHAVICNAGDSSQRVQWRTSSALVQVADETSCQLAAGDTYDLLLKWDGTKEQRWGVSHETLDLVNESGQKLSIDLTAVLLPDVTQISESDRAKAPQLQTDRRVSIDTWSPEQKTALELTIRNTGGSDLHLYRIYSEQAEISIDSTIPMTIPSGATAIIKLKIIPHSTSNIPITLISDDVKKPRQTVRISSK